MMRGATSRENAPPRLYLSSEPSCGHTPPTPAQTRGCAEIGSPLAEVPPNVPPHTPAPNSGPPCTPALCTPANPPCSITPPANLRRDSLFVPPSAGMVRLARGSGVTVYRIDRSPLGAMPRSPWVIKKSDNSPMLGRERRRVEKALELESRVLSKIDHPHIVGFRAAQRLPDGRLGLVLEACECSVYGLIQERQFELGCTPGPLFKAAEVLTVCRGIALALVHLHNAADVLHGDVKSANILASRDLAIVKLCDLGVSMPLGPARAGDEPRGLQRPELHIYQGTEQWRPPEAAGAALFDETGEGGGGGGEEEAHRFAVSDRSDVWAAGLVVWEMLTGDVPHSDLVHKRGDEAYRAALGTRPPLPPSVSGAADCYRLPLEIHHACTQHEPRQRPSARQLCSWLAAAAERSGTSAAE